MNPFNHKITRATRHIAFTLLASFLLASCGGGGNNNTSSQNNTAVIGTVHGIVSPPSGVDLSSLTIVSLGDTTPVDLNGSFSANVYKDGVAVVAAIQDGKEFGLMNVAVTAPSAIPLGVSQVKIMAAASLSANSTLTINAHTTAVSMVFVTPYFLTNDPVKAGGLISIIDSDPKVAALAIVIENVLSEADPLSNPILQQALLTAVESVLGTISAQILVAPNAAVSASINALYLPKVNNPAFAAAISPSTSKSYYADQDYITVIANPSTPSAYDLSVENKNSGG